MKHKLLAGIVTLCWIVGCGAQPPTNNTAPTDTPDETQTPQPTPTPNPTEPINMTGTWGAQFVTSQTFTTDVADPTSTTLTTIAKIDIEQDEGGSLTTTVEICDLDLAPLGDTIITWPEATVDNVDVALSQANVDGDKPGSNYSAQVVALVAWQPDMNVATEALPIDANDARVFDADGDGEVGSTLLVDSTIDGEVYGVARTVVDLSGSVMDANRVEGGSDTVLELNILDASSNFLEIDISAEQDDVVPSDFVLHRMTGNAECADILAAADSIF